MNKLLLYCVIAVLFSSATLYSCSNNKDAESEKGKIEAMTEKIGKEIVSKIQNPIEKARSVKNQQNDQTSAMVEALPKQ